HDRRGTDRSRRRRYGFPARSGRLRNSRPGHVHCTHTRSPLIGDSLPMRPDRRAALRRQRVHPHRLKRRAMTMTKGIVITSLIALSLLLGGCANISSGGPEDRGSRTYGMQVEDQGIENRLKGNLSREDARFNDARIKVDSYNGIVLLTGQVPSEELK